MWSLNFPSVTLKSGQTDLRLDDHKPKNTQNQTFAICSRNWLDMPEKPGSPGETQTSELDDDHFSVLISAVTLNIAMILL